MSEQLNQRVRRIFQVLDIAGLPVTGLVTGNFTLTLQRQSADTLVAASETVTVTEISGGLYYVDYTPTADVGLYYLTVSHATHIVSPDSFQVEIESGFASSAGPYLTTRVNVRTALDIKATDQTYTTAHDDDARIDMLLAAVTDFAETYCGRDFFSATQTEYKRALSDWGADKLFLKVTPVSSIVSVHVSTDRPRVYDATTILVADQDYIVEEDSGILHRIDGDLFPSIPKGTKVIYVGGYSTIPADLEWAAIETVGFNLYRAEGKLLHLTSESKPDGSVGGVRFDIPETSKRVFDLYRSGRRAA